MAKDAKGHGSEKRGARAAAEKAHNAAYGPHGFGTSDSYKQSHPPLTQSFAEIHAALNSGFDKDKSAADALAQGGGPKATAAPVHGGAAGRFGPFAGAVAGFREKYGAPRDHAAEQRGFNSGKREINRLKRQGK